MYTEGQYLFTTSWGESVYAHFYNGVLFSAYQDGSNFKPRHWLVATGQMTEGIAACFAENDPHTPPPPPNPTPNPTPTTANFAGTLDGADCYGIRGWVANRNTPHISTKIDIYVNGWLAAASVPATQSRQDVANALGISGYNYFGFNVPFPAKYRKGKVLDISVKYAGTRTHIPGSPITTAACPYSASAPPAGIAAGDCEPEHTARVVGSDQAMSTVHARTGNTSLLLSRGGAGRIASLTSRLIPVRQGDVLSLDGYVYALAPAKANFRPQIASAVAGGVVAGLTLTQPKPTQPDQRATFQSAPAIGLSTVLVVPLVKSLLANQLPNASLELAFYDRRGHFVHRQQVHISKLARDQWELLSIQTQVPQDGYVAVRMQNHSKTPVWFDDVWLTPTPKSALNTDPTVHNFPALHHRRNGFTIQVDTSPQELYSFASDNCDNTIDGGTLDVNVDVRAKRSGGDNTTPPASNGSNSSGDEGWTGSSDGNYGGGTPTGGSIEGTPNGTFTPYGAPKTPKLAQTYHSPYTGVNYIWDGENWCIVLPLSEVKGTPPTYTYQGRTYVYYDPTYGYTTRYTYLNGHWTLPVANIDDGLDIEHLVDICKGYKRMLELQRNNNKEIVAFVTTNGDVFILPYSANDQYNSYTQSIYTDNQDRRTFVVYNEGSEWYLITFDYSGDPNNPTTKTYTVSAHIHTHPSGSNSATPSPDRDVPFTNNYPGLSKYILTDQQYVNYTNPNQTISQQLNRVCP